MATQMGGKGKESCRKAVIPTDPFGFLRCPSIMLMPSFQILPVFSYVWIAHDNLGTARCIRRVSISTRVSIENPWKLVHGHAI